MSTLINKKKLITQGFTQTYGINYKETFTLVEKMNIILTFLLVFISHGWSLFQMDRKKNLFLLHYLQNERYIKLPLVYPQSSDPKLACKLDKSIYI